MNTTRPAVPALVHTTTPHAYIIFHSNVGIICQGSRAAETIFWTKLAECMMDQPRRSPPHSSFRTPLNSPFLSLSGQRSQFCYCNSPSALLSRIRRRIIPIATASHDHKHAQRSRWTAFSPAAVPRDLVFSARHAQIWPSTSTGLP